MAKVPAHIPETVDALDRAISLLGNRGNGQELTPAMQQVLVDTLGGYPEPKAAKAWKRVLKARRAELVGEPRDEEEDEPGQLPPLPNQPAAIHTLELMAIIYPGEDLTDLGLRLEMLIAALRTGHSRTISQKAATEALAAAFRVLVATRL